MTTTRRNSFSMEGLSPELRALIASQRADAADERGRSVKATSIPASAKNGGDPDSAVDSFMGGAFSRR
jgi:hypothetical protein